MKFFVVFCSIIAAIFLVVTVFVLTFSISVRPDALRLVNIQVTSNSVSFDYRQLDSGYSIKSYSYNVDNHGTLTLRFQGTIFNKFLPSKTSSDHITIDNIKNVNRIDISDSNETTTVWIMNEDTE